jgi:hypothetical protein
MSVSRIFQGDYCVILNVATRFHMIWVRLMSKIQPFHTLGGQAGNMRLEGQTKNAG